MRARVPRLRVCACHTMTATYANKSTSAIGSEERKTAWMFEEARGEKSSVETARVSHEGLGEDAQLEELLRTMKNEIEQENLIVAIETSCLSSQTQSNRLSAVIFESETKRKDEKNEENKESSWYREENIEQVSITKIIDEFEGKFSTERDISQSKDSANTSLHEKSIITDEGSLENIRQSIKKELTIVEDLESFNSKNVIVTYDTLEIINNAIIGEEEGKGEGKKEEEKEIINSKDESYDPETELDFHEAVRTGDAKCVATLLATGRVQNLDEPDWNVSGDPPLLVAATNHCISVLK